MGIVDHAPDPGRPNDPAHAEAQPAAPGGQPAGAWEEALGDRPDLAVAIMGHTPVGTLRISATADGVRTISFLDTDPELPPPSLSRSGSDATRARIHLRDAEAVLRGYFAGVCTTWDLPLDLEGLTGFQREIFQALMEIPFGKTRTYGDLAEPFGGKDHAQAVGQAVGSNPIPILIPCHRVLRHDHSLGGFSGGLSHKATLLRLEGLDVDGASASTRVIEGGLRLDL
jgi:methylated-DNA-[protein]-cysteine S-methyltransferase